MDLVETPNLDKILSQGTILNINKYRQRQQNVSLIQMNNARTLARKNIQKFVKDGDFRSGAKFLSIQRDEFIDLLPYRHVQNLAESASGNVCLMQSTLSPDELVAGKEFDFEGDAVNTPEESNMLWARFVREVSILQEINYSFIVKYKLAMMCPSKAMITMEFCEYGALWKHLPKMSLNLTKLWFVEIACAVRYLHQNNIVHRDIKVDNVLVRGDYTVALSDFDMSEKLTEGNRMVTGWKGTPGFMAPELASHRDNNVIVDGYKADAFSLGIVLLCMSTKTYPEEARQILLSGSPTPALADANINFCLHQLMNESPAERADVIELMKNPIFNF